MANAVVADRSERTAERTDEQLVGAVRRGDDRAFEQLYARYQRRIGAYVFGMVKDHGRAEDITQEVFVSALRRMRETERPIAFKAWIYEIARNACIDAYRRARRAEEVSYDADDRLSPSDQVRLVAAGPEPDAAVDAKQELDHLCGAFGGLSDSHHEILVLRELEGRSYKDIGERMGMSRPAVESTLFRARRRLSEEYDELVSGARCLRTEAIIAAGGQRLGVREQRRLARHVSHCQPCRLLALQAGLELPAQRRRRIAERIAGLLPLPAFLRGRRGGDEATTTLGAGGNGWMAHVPSVADSIGSGWSKGAAGLAALLLAGAGAGVTGFGDSAKRDERGTGYRAADVRASAGDAAAAAPRRATLIARERAAGTAQRAGGTRGSGGGGKDARSAPSGGGDTGATRTPARSQDSPRGDAPATPSVDAPAAVPDTDETADTVTGALPGVQETTDTVAGALPGVQETTDTVTGALPDVDETVEQVAPQLPVDVPDAEQVVPQVTEPLDDAVDDVTGLLGP